MPIGVNTEEPIGVLIVTSNVPMTVGAEKGYDCADFVEDLSQTCVTLHMAQKIRHSAVDGRTTRHPGSDLSQKLRKKTCEPFGWA